MKKLTLICASIAVLCGGAANAGTLSTGTTFAVENFGGSTSAATDSITPGSITYSLSTITAVNAGATVYFTVRLNGATFNAAPAASTILFAGSAVGAGAAVGAVPGVTFALSADKTTLAVAVANGNTSATLGLGAFTYTPASGDIVGVNGTLATAGGVVTSTVALSTTSPGANNSTALNTVDLATISVDGTPPVGNFATAAKAINGVVSNFSSNAVPYTAKIDLTATPPGNAYTTGLGNPIAIGSVKFTNVTGTQNKRSGASDYTLASGSGNAANTGAKVTVTPTTGAFPVGSTFTLTTDIGCTTAVANTTVPAAITASTAGTAKDITTTTAVTTGTEWFVCLSAPSGTNVAAPMTTTIAGTVAPAAGTDLIATASGAGYPLVYNGSQVDVKTYFPNALSVYGYGSYVRIVNTGTVAAVVSGALIDPTTGAVSAAGALTSSVPAGGAVMLTGAQIEAVVGTQALTARPRLRLTAPTNAMVVQYFLQNPSGTVTELSANQ